MCALYTIEKNMEYLESTMETLVFDIWYAGNSLAPITVKYSYFSATLKCNVMDTDATCNVQN